jgi:hypothetical protein
MDLTVSRVLSAEDAALYQEWIANRRRLDATLGDGPVRLPPMPASTSSPARLQSVPFYRRSEAGMWPCYEQQLATHRGFLGVAAFECWNHQWSRGRSHPVEPDAAERHALESEGRESLGPPLGHLGIDDHRAHMPTGEKRAQRLPIRLGVAQ